MKNLKQVLCFIFVFAFAFAFNLTACSNHKKESSVESVPKNQTAVLILESHIDFLEVEEKLIDCGVKISGYGTISKYYFDGIKLYLTYEPLSENHYVYFARLMTKNEKTFVKADAVYRYSDLPLFAEETQEKNGYLIVFNNLYGKDLSEVILNINDMYSQDFEINGAKAEEKAIGKIFSGDKYAGELFVESIVYGERVALIRCTLPEEASATSVMIIYETKDSGGTQMPHNIGCEILERNGQDILVQAPFNMKSIDEFRFVSKNMQSVDFGAVVML
ncbi:MAG: hypothetical protein J6Q83_06825 [Clostridia bacterium]|nr:hypothetical protein [Clostridia bacterium]